MVKRYKIDWENRKLVEIPAGVARVEGAKDEVVMADAYEALQKYYASQVFQSNTAFAEKNKTISHLEMLVLQLEGGKK